MSKISKMLILLASILILCSSVLGQESVTIMTIGSSNMDPDHSIGVKVNEEKVTEVSYSVLMAEKWLRSNVLSYYPFNYIKTIIVANDVCNDDYKVGLVLDCVKNLYYSLTRWGLEKEIKVSVFMKLDCVNGLNGNGFFLKSVFGFLEKINSSYTVSVSKVSDEVVEVVSSEMKKVNELGFGFEKVNVVVSGLKQGGFMSRKLSVVDGLGLVASPPAGVFEFPPEAEMQAPMVAPASGPAPHYGVGLPPCNPYPRVGYHADPPVVGGNVGGSVAAPPMVATPASQAPVAVGNGGGSSAAPPISVWHEKLWCVAKPSVPSDKLQVALDYACGAGGADCGPIKPNGSCYSPDSVVAHASYAFNSYWQKNKKNGGVCGFGGTAMLISSDPSFSRCHFILE